MTTIYALSSAMGRAAIAIIRISGAECANVWRVLTSDRTLPPPRQTVLRWLKNPATEQRIDHAMAVFFAAPHSFTGEDVLELMVHGSPVIVQTLLSVLAQQPLCAPAAPGEFTRRAVHHGKMNLLQSEALGDILESTCEAQLYAALHDYTQHPINKLHDIRHSLLDAVALAAVMLDFSDQDLPNTVHHQLQTLIHNALAHIQQHITGACARQRLRQGYSIAVVGAPNAGKSSLVNALVGRDMAIVSPQAGTTRDVLEAHFNINGWPVVLADTAGLRSHTHDIIEQEGIKRATHKAQQSHTIIWVYDARMPCPPLPFNVPEHSIVIKVANKIDLLSESEKTMLHDALPLSLHTRQGLTELQHHIATTLQQNNTMHADIMVNNRHLTHLREAEMALQNFLARPYPDLLPECGVVELQHALRALDLLLGYHDIEQVLDRVFAGFCIGK